MESLPMEDLWPFLDREEFESNMLERHRVNYKLRIVFRPASNSINIKNEVLYMRGL